MRGLSRMVRQNARPRYAIVIVGWGFVKYLRRPVYSYCPELEYGLASFEDTLLAWNPKPEMVHGNKTGVQPGVQA